MNIVDHVENIEPKAKKNKSASVEIGLYFLKEKARLA